MVTQKRAFLLFGLMVFGLGFAAGHFISLKTSSQHNQTQCLKCEPIRRTRPPRCSECSIP
ncbi:MAG: hypothetical protein Ct9H300mP25_02550 [Acidobacteriota bacterium]|nr:MAG: hypothetical protein Ct9H300mP25_02550 [Acidobacteriota bacterium]